MPQPASLAALTAPAADFERPFEMLHACHGRLQRMLALLARLRDHLPCHGADVQAQQAARDVMRYFDEAAPQHHRDEELHVFPPVAAHGDAAQRALVERLQQDHRRMEAGWDRARAVLAAIADGSLQQLSAVDAAALQDFSDLHAGHLAAEEDLVYPAAGALLDAAAQAAAGAEMRARRGVKARRVEEAAPPGKAQP